MAPSPLIDATSRLLGWPLSDLTLYGAQPTTGVVDGTPVDGEARIGAGDATRPETPVEATAAHEAPILPTIGEVASSGLVNTALTTLAHPSAFAMPVLAAANPIAPVALTNGVFAPAHLLPGTAPVVVPAARPTTALVHGDDTPSPDHAAIGSAGPLPHDAVAESLSVAADLVSGLAHAATPVSALPPMLDSLVAHDDPADVVSAIAGAVDTTLSATTATLAPAATTTVASVIDGLHDDGVLAHDSLVATIPAATAAVGATLAATTTLAAAAASTVTPVVDGLHDIGGTDPAGGIVTLVGMVETADPFHLASNAAPAAAAQPAIIDTLADDIHGAAPLIGDVHHDLSSALDGHHHPGSIL